jgi:hypothetical protein
VVSGDVAGYDPGVSSARQIEVRVFFSHEEARRADLLERASMSMEERLRLGAELHAFWARNHFPNATRLDRTVRVVDGPEG